GWGGGALGSRRAGAGVGTDVAALATAGSSLSLGRSRVVSRGEGGGRLRSGNARESREGGRSRAGRSRDGKSRGASRRGSSAGGSSTRGGGIETPCGEPTAAVAGASTT